MNRRECGQSIVEMALILPFLLLITVGTMELGYYIYTYSELENATRRAAEWASTTPPFTAQSCDDVIAPATRPSGCPSQSGAAQRDECASLIKQHALDNIFLSNLAPADMTISIVDNAAREKGEIVQIATSYQGQWLSPIGRRFFGNVMRFQFTARRTIMDTSSPMGYEPNCTPT
jgi:hypothetical protein